MTPATETLPKPQGVPAIEADDVTYMLVNGIMTLPSDRKAWTDRGIDWIRKNTPHAAEAQEYFCPPGLAWRSLNNDRQVFKLVDWIRKTPGRIRLVGHSNGCDIICQAAWLSACKIDAIYLIAGAVEHDFRKNHLHNLLHFDQVREVGVFASLADGVLKWLARPTRAVFGQAGYGYLGYAGALPEAFDLLHVAERFRGVRVWLMQSHRLGHGDWLQGNSFESTFQLLTDTNRCEACGKCFPADDMVIACDEGLWFCEECFKSEESQSPDDGEGQ